MHQTIYKLMSIFFPFECSGWVLITPSRPAHLEPSDIWHSTKWKVKMCTSTRIWIRLNKQEKGSAHLTAPYFNVLLLVRAPVCCSSIREVSSFQTLFSYIMKHYEMFGVFFSKVCCLFHCLVWIEKKLLLQLHNAQAETITIVIQDKWETKSESLKTLTIPISLGQTVPVFIHSGIKSVT